MISKKIFLDHKNYFFLQLVRTILVTKYHFFFKRQKNQLCYKNPWSHLKKFLFLNRPYLYKRLRVANPILIPSLWHRWQLNRNIFKCFCNKKEKGRIKMRIMLWKKRENNVEKTFKNIFFSLRFFKHNFMASDWLSFCIKISYVWN